MSFIMVLDKDADLEFSHFKGNEFKLVGMYVLVEVFCPGPGEPNRYIRKIGSITKTGFRLIDAITKDIDMSQSFNFNGNIKGVHSVGYSTLCTLLTDKEAADIIVLWKTKKDIQTIKKFIIENVKNLQNMNNLNSIKKIIESEILVEE